METREYSICGFSNNYLIKVLIFITFFLYGLDVSAQENKKFETVIIEGVGSTVESASINAGKNAVRQVVGMYTVTDTVVENSKLIKDQILSNSNGFIKSFTILNTTENNGLFYVEAKVEVVLGSVISRLNDNNIATHNIGSTSFKVVALDKFDVQNNFKELAEKVIFEPLKLNKKVYDVEILDFKASDNRVPSDLMFKKQDGREKFNLGELLSFDLDFKLSLNQDYIDSIDKFLTHATKNNKKSEHYFLMIRIENSLPKVETFYLSKKQHNILRQLVKNFHIDYKFVIDSNYFSNKKKYYLIHQYYRSGYGRNFWVDYDSPGILRNYESSPDSVEIRRSFFELYYKHDYELYERLSGIDGINYLMGLPNPNSGYFKLYIVQNKSTFTNAIILDRKDISEIDNIKINPGWHKR